jgi:hypothetical protein
MLSHVLLHSGSMAWHGNGVLMFNRVYISRYVDTQSMNSDRYSMKD